MDAGERDASSRSLAFNVMFSVRRSAEAAIGSRPNFDGICYAISQDSKHDESTYLSCIDSAFRSFDLRHHGRL
jgi:hypothetical protein